MAVEWRAYVKIRTLHGNPATDILADLRNVYGHQAPSPATVRRWAAAFKSGKDTVYDRPHPGRPRSASGDNNVTLVQQLVEADARLSVREIQEATGIPSATVHRILRDQLHMRQICARWVPHILTTEQKRQRVQLAQKFLKEYKDCDPRRLSEIVTGDETYVHYYEPPTKQKNRVWLTKGGKRPTIARRERTIGKVLYAIFFDPTGIVAKVVVPKGRSVTGQYYANTVLPAVLGHYQRRRPKTGFRGIKLHHDNAPAHTSKVVASFLESNKVAVIPHPPYSPDLAPCDFWLFPYLKSHLAGKRYTCRSSLGSAVSQCLRGIPKHEYRRAFQQWIRRLQLCVDPKGEYFEGQQ